MNVQFKESQKGMGFLKEFLNVVDEYQFMFAVWAKFYLRDFAGIMLLLLFFFKQIVRL